MTYIWFILKKDFFSGSHPKFEIKGKTHRKNPVVIRAQAREKEKGQKDVSKAALHLNVILPCCELSCFMDEG